MKAKVWSVALLALILPAAVALSSAPAAPQAVSALGVTHGAHIKPTFNYGKEIAAFNTLTGKKIGLVMYFAAWTSFDSFLTDQIRAQMPASDWPIVMITWEPTQYSTGCNLNYGGIGPVPSINQGNCDAYLHTFARAIKAHPARFLLIVACEMNIPDSPWWAGYYNNDPSQYVAMWRRVYNIFAAEGVANVEWVWSPNYASHPPPTQPGYEWNTLHNYYPGDQYVDWIGLSGFNWYKTRPGARWDSFATLYDGVLRELACYYDKPQIIAQVGTVEGDASSPTKAQWIAEAYQAAPAYPFLRSVVWFNDCAFADCAAQPDFRVTTSTGPWAGPDDPQMVDPLPQSTGAWTTAYKQAIAASAYTSVFPSLQAATPPRVYCGEAPAFQVNPDVVLVMPGEGAVLTLTGFGYTQTRAIALNLPALPGLSGYAGASSLEPFWGQTTIHLQTTSATPLGAYQMQVQVGGTSLPVAIKVLSVVARVYLPIVLRGRP